jgi:hypothetical protein
MANEAIIQAASRIFAAYIRAGRLTESNQAGLVRASVQLAQQIAREAANGSAGAAAGGAKALGGAAPAAAAEEGDILDLLE